MAKYEHLSDHELIRLLETADHSAFNELYQRYFNVIYIHVHKKVLDDELTKDIVQELFAMLWFKRESLPQIRNLAAYLFTAARNKIFDTLAHQRVQEKHRESLLAYWSENPIISTDHQIREAQLRAYIDRQIEALPLRMRQVFELSRKEQLSYQEIAEQLSTTENNVSKQVNSALRILRTKFSSLLSFLL